MNKKNPQFDLFKKESNSRVKKKMAQLIALAERGATEGEKNAARKGMERLISKYNIDVSNLDELLRQEYTFTWTSNLEAELFLNICLYFLDRKDFKIEQRDWKKIDGRYYSARELAVTLDQLEFITIECAYEYFRRHMKKEYKRIVLPQLKRCRKAKTRKARKEKLEPLFLEQYLIASRLVDPSHITKRDISEASKEELKNLFAMNGIQGGEFNQQVGNGLYLEE